MNRSVLKPYASQFLFTLRASDPLVGLGVGIVTYVAYLNVFPLPEHYVLFLVAACVAIVAVFPLFRLYEPRRGASMADELRRLLLAWGAIGVLAGITLFATKSGNAYSRAWVFAWLVGSFVATAAMRVLVRLALRALRRRGLNLRHVMVVGAGSLGRRIAERLRHSTWAGLNVVGYYDDDPEKIGTSIDGRPVRGPIDCLFTENDWTGIDQVWIALPLRAEARIRLLLTALRDSPVEVRFVPDIYSFHLLNHSFTEIAGLPVISLTETPMVGVNRLLKWLEDFVFGTVALVLAAPALIVIAAGVKLTSTGPVLYRQERMTWNGQRFQILKFRTMPVDAEPEGPIWPQNGVDRATGFGAFLRRFSLDELPQLINVLKGEMSLVGPRPERPEFVARFRQEIAGYMQKHLVKAGITGWAQVNDLRGDSDLIRRIEYDLYYIDHWSIWFDLRILALTLWNILTSRHAR
jgi:putative colanic acid biosynthesis UDP-glucose lipid carrier transferase